MRIAFLSYDFGEYCVRQANAMAACADVLLMLPEELAGEYRTMVDPAVQLRPFRQPRLRQPLRQYRSIHAMFREIDAYRPDVIHIQHGHLWFNWALPRLRRYPLVVTIHDARHHPGDRLSQKTPQMVLDFGFRQADHVIVHGRNLVPVVVSKIGVPPERIHVVPHVAIGELTASKQIAEDKNLVLFFGRLWAYKGLDYLIRAEPEIAKRIPEVQIMIAGTGEDFAAYRRMMVHPERFIVHNDWIDDRQRAGFFQRAAVVVLPYIEASQSGVVPVAYTFGKPVVATRVGGLPESVDHEHTGLLVPPKDEKALAAAIVRLLKDDGLRRAMGRNGRLKLERESTPSIVAGRNMDVYRQAIDTYRRRRLSRLGA